MMGRPKTKNLDLPARMHQKGKSFYYVVSEYGKRKWIALGNDKVKALLKWAELEGRSSSLAEDGTVAYCIDKYLLEILPDKTLKTQSNYKRSANAINGVFGEMAITSVKPQHIYQYLDMHPKPLVANSDIKLFSVVFSFSMRWGYCHSNPCIGVKRNPAPPRDRYITDHELLTIIKAAPPRMSIIIKAAYITAMRKGDLIGIKLSDVCEDGVHVQQGKTGKKQIFEWTDDLRAITDEAKALFHRGDADTLFVTRSGMPYTASGFDSNWKRLIKKLGIHDVHFHDIRGKAITDAKNATGIDHAQALAGHKNASMTEQYVRQMSSQNVKPIGIIKGKL